MKSFKDTFTAAFKESFVKTFDMLYAFVMALWRTVARKIMDVTGLSSGRLAILLAVPAVGFQLASMVADVRDGFEGWTIASLLLALFLSMVIYLLLVGAGRMSERQPYGLTLPSWYRMVAYIYEFMAWMALGSLIGMVLPPLGLGSVKLTSAGLSHLAYTIGLAALLERQPPGRVATARVLDLVRDLAVAVRPRTALGEA